MSIGDDPNKRDRRQADALSDGVSAEKGPISKISDFSPNPLNPRKISDEQLAALKKAMIEFGDLSGLVVNKNSGQMIGGHQRVKILGDLPVTILRRYAEPTARGTVAEGFVEYEGERFIYREVLWTPTQEKAAMVAANKHGGDWEWEMVSDILKTLETEGYDMDLTGFGEHELENLLHSDWHPTGIEELNLGDEVRVVTLQLNMETFPVFMEWIRQLGERFNHDIRHDNVSDTVYRAVEECYKSHYGDSQTATAPLVNTDLAG